MSFAAHPTDLELLRGVDAEPDSGTRLHAGPVDVLLLDGDLRYVRRGDVELARRIQVAVRSADWDTVPGERSDETIEQGADSFRVTFDSHHRHGELDFRWRCTIDGASDGTITYTMDGAAERDFPYRRISLCVLHPTDVFSGSPFEAGAPSGQSSGTLPASVGPQAFDGENFPPLFQAFNRLRLTGPDGLGVTFAFEGDVFEMEDQRNWTDASFKSYGQNPLARPEPWEVRAGTVFRQQVTISTDGGGLAAAARPTRPTVTIGDAVVGHVPALGVALTAGHAHTDADVARLRELHLAHLRVDLHLRDQDWGEQLERAAELATKIGCALELAVFAGGDTTLSNLANRLAGPRTPPIARLVVFAEGSEVTPAELVEHAREAVASVPVGGGTDVYFAELNREPGFPPSFEVLSYPVTPQVHSDDDLSLIETPIAQADTVRRARMLAPGAAIAVTPITLKPRYNPDAPDAPTPVDARQRAQITAAWTLASVGRLGEAGAASATYFETVGVRGLFDEHTVFPVYDVLSVLAPLSGLELTECVSSHPLEVAAIHAEGTTIVANLTPYDSVVELGTGGLSLAGYEVAVLRG